MTNLLKYSIIKTAKDIKQIKKQKRNKTLTNKKKYVIMKTAEEAKQFKNLIINNKNNNNMQKVNNTQDKDLIFESFIKNKNDENIKKIEKIEKQNEELLKKVNEMLKTSEAHKETIEWVIESLEESESDEIYEEQDRIENKLNDLIYKRNMLEHFSDELSYNNETPKERIEIERKNRNLIYEIIGTDYKPEEYFDWELEERIEFLEKKALIEEILESAFLLKESIIEKAEVMTEQEKSIYNNMINQLLIKVTNIIKN